MMKRTLLTLIFALAVFATYATTHKVTVKNYAFSPATLNVTQGDTVLWEFTEGTHTTTSGASCTKDNVWDSGNKNAGDNYSHVFTSTGTFTYFCTPHCGGGMTGSISVAAKTGIQEVKIPEAKITMMPNPFTSSTTVSVNLNSTSPVKLSLYDLSGRLVKEDNKIATTGDNSYLMDLNTYPSGMYLLMVNINGTPYQSKLLIKE